MCTDFWRRSRDYIISAETIRQAVKPKCDRASFSVGTFWHQLVPAIYSKQSIIVYCFTHMLSISLRITVSATFWPLCYPIGKQEFLNIGSNGRHVQIIQIITYGTVRSRVWKVRVRDILKPIRAEPSTVKPNALQHKIKALPPQ